MVDDRERKTQAIREHWAGIVSHAHDAIAGKLDARSKQRVADYAHEFERDVSPHVAPLVEHLLDDETIPEPIRNLLRELATPQHQTGALLLGIALGGMIAPVLGAIVGPAVEQIADTQWTKNPYRNLSPAEAALAVLRHNPHLADPAGEALTSGIDQSRFNALVYNTGDSLPMGELLQLYRRNLIDQGRLQTGLRQSRMRDEWFPEILDLRYQPPGAGTVITGVLKAHLSEADGRKKLAEAGIDPTNFEWMKDSSGRPPGIMSMVGLWNRGYTSQAKVEQAVRQSDINPDYMAEVLALRWYHVPPRSIVPMLRSGSITEARARVLLSEHGVRPEDQDAFLREATQHRDAVVKSLSASQVARAYENRLIVKGEALQRLGAIKYNAVDAELLLDIADTEVAHRALAAATTRIHSLYVHRKITRAEASADLSKVGQPAAAITQLLALWDEELTIDTPHLSMSQWGGALRREIITLTEFIARAHAAGWSGLPVKVLAAEAFPAGHVPTAVMALNPANL